MDLGFILFFEDVFFMHVLPLQHGRARVCMGGFTYCTWNNNSVASYETIGYQYNFFFVFFF